MLADTFHLLQFDGEEEVSKLYHFELRLVSRDPDIDFESVLQSSAQLAITAQGNTRYLNGMLSEFEQRGQWQNGLYEYRAVLVPRLWIMAQSTQNQIFQEQTVPAIVESELGSVSNKGSHPLVRDGLSVDDYEIYTIRDYDEREYVVQYKETDHNFISRLMEHEGIYYYFEQDETREKLIVTDAMATDEIGNDSYATFQTEASASHYDTNVVYKLNRLQKQIPDSVLIKDFNYRSPSMPMQSDSVVDKNGVGFVTEFGAHFKEPEQGEVLATLRTEEYRCRQNVYTGESNIAAMTCAGLYSLGQHFRREYNQTYMITRVRHSGSQEIESWGNVGSTQYKNEFDCIPSGLPYRPQRLTPKPKLYGIMNGTIDSELDTGRADIDELGRYKVMMPFDISGVGEGMGSRRIRMAQPYGGGGSGMSFPLVKGTEVIWTCIDGDIDRPIITGAVPNPLNPSVTTAENNTSNVIKTSSGITMGFHDGSGGGRANTTGGGAGGGLAAQQQFQSNDPSKQSTQVIQGQSAIDSGIVESSTISESTLQNSIDKQQQMMSENIDLGGGSRSQKGTANEGKQWQIFVPDYEETGADTVESGSKDSYLRMGKSSNVYGSPDSDSGEESVYKKDGWFEYTDGDRVMVTQGEKIEYINGGNYSLNISSGALMESDASQMWHDSFNDVGGGIWRRCTFDWTSSTHITLGDSEEIFAGAKFDGFIGLATGVTVGGTLNAELGQFVTYKKGPDFTFGKTVSNDLQIDRVEVSTMKHQMTAGKRVRINVSPERALGATASDVPSAAALAGIVAATTAAAAAVPLLLTASGEGETNDLGAAAANSAALGVGYGIATAFHKALIAKGYADVALCSKEGGEIAELDIKVIPPSIRMGMGAETGPPVPMVTGPGIDIGNEKITIGFGPTNSIVITPDGIKFVTPKLDCTVAGPLTLTSTGPLTVKAGASASLTMVPSGSTYLKGTTDVKIQGATSQVF
jgi:type VI secretion system VgrG family protein